MRKRMFIQDCLTALLLISFGLAQLYIMLLPDSAEMLSALISLG